MDGVQRRPNAAARPIFVGRSLGAPAGGEAPEEGQEARVCEIGAVLP